VTSTAAAVRRATAVGSGAILLWSTLAVFTTLTTGIPPLQLVAMTFGVGAVLGLAVTATQGRGALAVLRQPGRAWVLGVGGLFGYHFLYFLALKAAPPVEANLLNYLWPLLIVLFSALLPGERLRWWHAAGAAAGLAGTALLVTRGGERLSVDAAALPGYLAALGCAFTWSGYSVLSRRLGRVPTGAVGGFCLAAATLAAAGHLCFEPTVAPRGAQWAVILFMGAGPTGAAFFAWDHGVKRGDIRALGGLSYAAPLLSTFLLVLAGRGSSTHWSIWAAGALVTGGALLAARDLYRRR
jgi:drug/metabolite transporter (DMT)-like permease